MIVQCDAKENTLDYDKPSWHGNTIRSRLLKKLIKRESGCWEWQGSITGNNHYGNMRIPQQGLAYVHRLSYVMHRGPIPDNMRVLHKCDNSVCCNPDHLFLGTQEDNIKDRTMKKRTRNRYSIKQLGTVRVQEGGNL